MPRVTDGCHGLKVAGSALNVELCRSRRND